MGDDAVFEAVRGLAEAGQYRDDLPGLPGDHSPEGWEWQVAGSMVPMYRRGSKEHRLAEAEGRMGRLPALVPASVASIEQAERVIGHRLPGLLRRLYAEVANGGFGPGYGVLGVTGGHHDGGQTALDLYQRRPEWWASAGATLVPICHWGCAIYSFIDCSTDEGPIWGFDPNPGPVDAALFPQGLSFAGWLARWIDGNLFQPTLIYDDAMGRWRGASDSEIRDLLIDE